MLHAWLDRKSGLYNKNSLFRCEDACARNGCRGDLLVTASIFEIYVHAKHLERPVAEVFKSNFRIAPFVEHGFEAVRVRFVLRKPCLFLNEAGFCSMYEKRPAACALFPEVLSLDGAIRNYADDDVMRSYPCIEHFADVPTNRKEALGELLGMNRTEIYAEEIYFFGRAGFTLDLREEIARRWDSHDGDVVPFGIQSDALHAELSNDGRLQRIAEKIEELDTAGGLESLRSAMEIAEALNLPNVDMNAGCALNMR